MTQKYGEEITMFLQISDIRFGSEGFWKAWGIQLLMETMAHLWLMAQDWNWDHDEGGNDPWLVKPIHCNGRNYCWQALMMSGLSMSCCKSVKESSTFGFKNWMNQRPQFDYNVHYVTLLGREFLQIWKGIYCFYFHSSFALRLNEP